MDILSNKHAVKYMEIPIEISKISWSKLPIPKLSNCSTKNQVTKPRPNQLGSLTKYHLTDPKIHKNKFTCEVGINGKRSCRSNNLCEY